jgi:hypothetical protein
MGRPGALSRRFIVWQMSMPDMAFFVKVLVFRCAVQ